MYPVNMLIVLCELRSSFVREAHVGVHPSKVPCLGGMILDLLGFTRVPEHHSVKSTTRKESSKDIRQTIEKIQLLFFRLVLLITRTGTMIIVPLAE